MGIRECTYLGVPVVNIGTRQNKRERGHNVVDVNYDKNEIESAILSVLNNKKLERSKIYGDGNAGEKIALLLESLPLKFHKTITY